MKSIFFVFLSVLAISFGNTFNAVGQNREQKSVREQHKIFIDRKGGIYDHDGTKLGHIDKDDIVRNNRGQMIYFIDKNGNVVDANGKKLGKARKDGSFYSTEGVSVLTVKDKGTETCEILDPQGHSMGTVHRNYKLHACAAHCLFLKQKAKARK